jgi:hypothetical protein
MTTGSNHSEKQPKLLRLRLGGVLALMATAFYIYYCFRNPHMGFLRFKLFLFALLMCVLIDAYEREGFS